jgi:subtilisin family serine protease
VPPRVQAGASARVTVVVRLAQPPLALHGRSLQGATAARKLDVASEPSRAYLIRLAVAQRAVEAELKRELPEATVRQRYRIVLNGLAVELPVRDLPALLRQPFATRVYPSLRYTLALDQSPAVIGTEVLAARTGARGDGMKIGIVDDGVDHGNPFFAPAGFSFPAGFPRGGVNWTTPKVIVARAFPGPGSGRAGRLPLDPSSSFHGTHVAGIAAGNNGTAAPRGSDHPPVAGLSGVAPRAWIGNYRVFNVPTPLGHIANTPEIVAAFESAVADGMDVINFSGGGPQTEPANDAMIETIRNVAAAGVVPVISAGNDRDEFGTGSVGTPGTAPEAISVAATSNTHVFARALDVIVPGAPEALKRIPFRPVGGGEVPAAWSSSAQTLVDVGTVVGVNGAPVDRKLCGPPGNPNEGASTLPTGSLSGSIALVDRGVCTFVSKSTRARAAGAIGVVVVDNRAGEAGTIPIQLDLPGGMIADLDGARLVAHTSTNGGRTQIQVGRDQLELTTGRSGVVTSFSAAGPTAFGHDLKPDVAAPGGEILSSTLPSAGGPFVVLDGTSMSAPHVAGAAALLRQRHPGWTVRQLKSALVSTAAPAWADTARSAEAPVTLAGGGLVSLPAADDPQLFSDPVSLSFDDLDVTRGVRREPLLVLLSDAGGGAGTWHVELRPQAATAGAGLELPGSIELPPGGSVSLAAFARAAADASPGENFGFVVLRRGVVVRRIPYFFLVTRPALGALPAVTLRTLQSGDTRPGRSQVQQYRYPSAPFGQPPGFETDPPMQQDGAERLYSIRLTEPVANFGVSVVAGSPGSAVDPWVLGSKDENDVQGYAGTPVNVNPLTFGFRADIGAAGASFPRPRTYYVSVDSGRDLFTGRPLHGGYVLQAWVNDVFPPFVEPVATRVSAGRPVLVVRAVDPFLGSSSGVDPLSLTIGYGDTLVGAAAYDPETGLAVVPLPGFVPALEPGRLRVTLSASDYQEGKNINTPGGVVYANTSTRAATLRIVAGPTIAWLSPSALQCAERRTRLDVVANSTRLLRSVAFFADGRRVATVRGRRAGVFSAIWNTRGAERGRHRLRAVVLDRSGRTAGAGRTVRVCG